MGARGSTVGTAAAADLAGVVLPAGAQEQSNPGAVRPPAVCDGGELRQRGICEPVCASDLFVQASLGGREQVRVAGAAGE